MHSGGVVILDYGSQYTQLIARRIRSMNVFSRILSWDAPEKDVLSFAGYVSKKPTSTGAVGLEASNTLRPLV